MHFINIYVYVFLTYIISIHILVSLIWEKEKKI